MFITIRTTTTVAAEKPYGLQCWTACLSIVFLLSIISLDDVSVHGYSSGAPNSTKVCQSLTPGHGSQQGTPSPYKLTSTQIDQRVQLDLVSTLQVTFAGFVVQARDSNDQTKIIDGYFTRTSENTHTKSCLTNVQNTWTHADAQPKTKVSAEWIPLDHFTGSIIFLASVVQVKKAYWDQIKSFPVYFIDGKIVNEKDYLENAVKKVPAALGSETAPQSSGLNYNDCDRKMCIGLGEDAKCLSGKSCQALLTVSRNDLDEKEFQILAKPNVNLNNVYYSVGLSDDDKMGDDFVVDCFLDSQGKVRVGLSHNDGKSNDPLPMDKSILQQSSGQYLDGIVQCRWKLKEKFRMKNKEYDLQKKHHIFVASGNMENDQGFKEYHDLKIKTPEPIFLASTDAIQFKDNSFLIRIHGSLMLIAWFGTVPIAIVLARYFKMAWPERLLCGVQVWFAFHRSLMLISLCLMVIAQICIFYYVGEYRLGLHQILGSIAFVLAILQPFGALFRPHPASSKRWIFNWMHWLGGTAGHICATAAIFLANRLKLANLSDTFLYIAIVWTLCHVVLNLIFQFYSFCISDSKTPDIAMHNMRQRELYEENKTEKNAFQYFLLTFYIILILFLMSVLVVFVVAPDLFKDLL